MLVKGSIGSYGGFCRRMNVVINYWDFFIGWGVCSYGGIMLDCGW